MIMNMTMKIILLCSLICFVSCAENSTCDTGYWGEGCQNYCGYCASDTVGAGEYNRVCNPSNGYCEDTVGCQEGYSGERCDQPICDDPVCDNGECVAPNVCQNCKDISHVAPNCVNLKLRGLLGSLMAFAVLISSLIGCTVGSVMYQRSKHSSVAL